MILKIVIIYAIIILLEAYDIDHDGADYLIVLGCRLDKDKATDALISRIERAVSYLKENPQCNVIVSGGITEGNTVSEAQVMKDLLIERGIEASLIIKEEKALDTYENFLYSKDLLNKDKKICFCSSIYHILRSRLMAHKNGLKVHYIFSKTTLKELLVHLPLEEFFIIHNLIKKQARS